MNLSGAAPVRERSIDPLEKDFPRASASSENTEGGEKSIAHLRLLWANRGFLCRVALAGLLASSLFAFLIPPRYKSTSRLMPPDNSPTSSLASAAAAMSGSAGGLGGSAVLPAMFWASKVTVMSLWAS